ncbi:MAG: MlaD family protein [Proteobacteria bacterium]|nr:MlaD family protein [Pseudomonadota bacterium]
MNEETPEQEKTGSLVVETEELVVEKARGLSVIWLIPLVALLIGGWLAYKTLSEQGPTITITFKQPGSLEAGKTKIKYKDVEVGVVETVKLSDDLSNVIVTAQLDKNVESHLGEGTQFWVVEPRFGLGGVSGLDTLIAGHYIQVEFSDGKPTREFIGLEHAPKISADTPGKRFTLMADRAGSLSEGTRLYFRDIQVGSIVGVRLADDRSDVLVDVFVDAPYDQLIHESSRFWQTSGIDISMGAQGIDVKVGSLLSLLGGGITFDTPNLNDPNNPPSKPGAKFWLHKDYANIAEGYYVHKIALMMNFEDSVRGLSVGAPVEVRGIQVGKVTGVKFNFDIETKKLKIPVYIEIDLDRIMPQSEIKKMETSFSQGIAAHHYPGIEALVAQGLRARLKTGNLLTGQLFVDLDFYHDDAGKKVIYAGELPELPTLPSVAEAFKNDISEILAKLKRLPLDKIGDELLGTVQGSNKLMNSEDVKDAIRSLNTTLKDVHQLAQTTDKEIVKLTASLDKSLTTAVKVLEQIDPGSPIIVDVGKALEELAASARSIRTLTDYLERHPEALLYGKGGAKK